MTVGRDYVGTLSNAVTYLSGASWRNPAVRTHMLAHNAQVAVRELLRSRKVPDESLIDEIRGKAILEALTATGAGTTAAKTLGEWATLAMAYACESGLAFLLRDPIGDGWLYIIAKPDGTKGGLRWEPWTKSQVADSCDTARVAAQEGL